MQRGRAAAPRVAGYSVRRRGAHGVRSPVLADAKSNSVCVWCRLLSVAGRVLRHSSGKFDPVRVSSRFYAAE